MRWPLRSELPVFKLSVNSHQRGLVVVVGGVTALAMQNQKPHWLVGLLIPPGDTGAKPLTCPPVIYLLDKHT